MFGSGRIICNRDSTLRGKVSQRPTLFFNCCFSFAELRSLVTLPAFECYPCGLNNAATSRILVNPAVILICYKQLQICIYFYSSLI